MSFNLVGKFNKIHVTSATMSLAKRGPDFHDIHLDEWIALGHRRLSIIDTSAAGNQPMWDESRRYAIIFNGEIFNYRELKQDLAARGVTFFSESDTEVLLKLYIREGQKCLSQLNGFFSFCIYDKQEQTFFLARDRFGVKPLLYVFDDDKFIFASEMKSIVEYGIDRAIDYTALYTFLQLNYIPAPHTIFTHVKKLLPGHSMTVRKGGLSITRWYEIPYDARAVAKHPPSLDEVKKTFRGLLDRAVQRRLVADVPLGAFLSGGIDSSVITGIAAQYKPDLHTFSIGFRDEKFFDETEYARLVAKHFNTTHTVFSLTNDDLFAHVNDILGHIDEPFADSSAINVYILSRETRRHATVALSGDGADEMLGGYNKHAAFLRMATPGFREKVAAGLLPLFRLMPQSRSNPFSNKLRQLVKFGEGMRLTPRERYWRWAGYAREAEAHAMLSPAAQQQLVAGDYHQLKSQVLENIHDDFSMNDLLLTDMKLVLPNDMLTKVDLMSMAHGLEVRTPFLDVDLVNFCFSLPADFKITPQIRKRVLQESFRDMLPERLYKRPKKGFEVPLLKWFRREMKSIILDDLLSDKFITEQGVFNSTEINRLKSRLFSANPGDVHARIWGLIVFQRWWKKFIR